MSTDKASRRIEQRPCDGTAVLPGRDTKKLLQHCNNWVCDAQLQSTTLQSTTPFTITDHHHYHRRHFDRAKAIAVVSNPATGKTLTLRVDDLVPLPHAADAKSGSVEWSAGFTSLLTRVKGTPLDTGTYPTTINGRTFPLTIIRVGENTYQVTVDRRVHKKGA